MSYYRDLLRKDTANRKKNNAAGTGNSGQEQERGEGSGYYRNLLRQDTARRKAQLQAAEEASRKAAQEKRTASSQAAPEGSMLKAGAGTITGAYEAITGRDALIAAEQERARKAAQAENRIALEGKPTMPGVPQIGVPMTIKRIEEEKAGGSDYQKQRAGIQREAVRNLENRVQEIERAAGGNTLLYAGNEEYNALQESLAEKKLELAKTESKYRSLKAQEEQAEQEATPLSEYERRAEAANSAYVLAAAERQAYERKYGGNMQLYDLSKYNTLESEEERLRQAMETAKSDLWTAQRRELFKNAQNAADLDLFSAPDEKKGGKDDTWRYINDDKYRAQAEAQSLSYGTARGKLQYSYMTDKEKEAYNYIYNRYGKKTADDYLEYLTFDLNARQQQKIRQVAEEGKLELLPTNKWTSAFASLLSVPANLMSGAGFIDVAAQKAQRDLTGSSKPIDYNRSAQTMYNAAQGTRQGTAENFKTAGGQFMYQTVMSMADSLGVIGLSLIGVPGTTFLLGGSAATDAMHQAKEAGATDDQAIAMGFLSGAAETVFEEFSLEYFLDWFKSPTPKNIKQVLKNIMLQGAGEGSEEFFTTIANTISEMAVLGDAAEMQRNAKEYIELGATEDEAKRLVVQEWLEGLSLDALGGFVSGGLFGIGGSIAQPGRDVYNRRQKGKNIKSEGNTGLEVLSSYIIKNGEKYGAGTVEKAQEIADIIKEGDKVSKSMAGQLVELIEADNPEFMKNTWPTLADEIDRRAESAEKEKAVSEDTDSTAVNDNPAEHTAEQQRIIEEYKNAVDEGLKKFVEKVKTLKNQKYRNSVRYTISPVSTKASQKVLELSGVDVTGFENIITGSAIDHIEKRHGTSGKSDHSMSDINDLARVGYILENFDGAYLLPNKDGTPSVSDVWKNSDGTPAQRIVFYKDIDSTFYAAEAVPDSKARVLVVESAFIGSENNKGSTGTVLDMAETAPQVTSEAPQRADAPTTTVTQEMEKSKSESNTETRNEVNKNGREQVQNSERSGRGGGESAGGERTADAGASEGVQSHDTEGVRGDNAAGRVYTAGDGQEGAGELRQQDTAINRQNSVRAYGVEPISSQEAGIKKGSRSETVFEMPVELYDNELKAIAADAEKNGVELHVYTGILSLKNGRIVDGYHKNGVVWIKADSNWRTATEAYDHEKFHMAVGRNKSAFAAVANWVKTMDKGRLAGIVEKYVQRYRDAYDLDSMSEDEAFCAVMEEILADAYAGADVFKADATEYTQTARAIAEELGATKNSEYNQNQGRAPPQGMTYEDVKNAVREVISELTGNKSGTQTQENGEKYARTDEETDNDSDYDAPITEKDIDTIRSIGRKSINDFTSEDIKKSEKWAHKFYQALGTKSPFFRAWFGDWRANDMRKIKYVQVNSDFISNRNEIPRGTFVNRDTEWQIKSTSDGIDETTAKRTKHSEEYHALKDIDSMISNAVLLDTTVVNEPSKRMGKNAVFVHHLYCPILIDGKRAVAKMYVTEDISDTKRFYLTKIEKVPTAVGLNSDETVPGAKSTAVDTAISVSDIFNFVKENDVNYEADSKRPVYFTPKPVNPVMLNDDGTPRVFYHGTDSSFTEFKASEFGNREGSYFFAQNYEDAAAYTASGNVMEVYVSLENPIDYNDMPSEIYKLRDKRAQVEALKELGYDGWYADMDTGWGEVSAFYPEQIKSATDNIGTFNSGDRDIRYAISPDLEEELDAVLDGSFNARNNEVVVGTTSDFLVNELGADVLSNTMPARKAYAAMVSEERAKADGRYEARMHYHDLGAEGLANALKAAEKPIAAIAAAADEKGNKRFDRIVLVTDQKSNGNNIVVVNEVNTAGRIKGKNIKVNKTITAFDNTSVYTAIRKAAEDGRLLYLDKKRSQSISTVEPREFSTGTGKRNAGFARSQSISAAPSSSLESDLRNVDFKANIDAFWANVKWKKSGAAEYYSGTPGNTAMQDAFEKAFRENAENERYAIAGERSKTADLQSLEEAKRRASEGEDAGSIYEETGWYQGSDGKWRYEIDDSGMEYHRGGDAAFSENHPKYARYQELLSRAIFGSISAEEQTELRSLDEIWGREYGRLSERIDRGDGYLSDVIKHDKLFEAYPELRAVRVEFGDTRESRGQYNRSRNTIVISEKLRNAPESTLLHEIQHAIQKTEGFAEGANPEYWEGVLKRGEQIYSKGMNEALNALIEFEANPENAPVIEAYKDLKRTELEGDTEDRYDRVYQWAQDMGYEDKLTEYEDLLFDFEMEKERQNSKTPRELYYNTAGEEEARDVSARRGMSAAERRRSMPGTGNRDTVFAKRGERSYEIKYPEFSQRDITENVQMLADMDSVYDVDADKLRKSGKRPSELYTEFFESLGNNIYSDRFGDIALTKSSVKSEIRHGTTAEKLASIEAIPEVINSGEVIFANRKAQSDVDRIVVAAPIKIGTESYYMGVMLQRDSQNQRLYLHNVAIEKETSNTTQADLLTTGADAVNENLFITKILQDAIAVKKNINSDQKYALSPEEQQELDNLMPEQRLWEDVSNKIAEAEELADSETMSEENRRWERETEEWLDYQNAWELAEADRRIKKSVDKAEGTLNMNVDERLKKEGDAATPLEEQMESIIDQLYAEKRKQERETATAELIENGAELPEGTTPEAVAESETTAEIKKANEKSNASILLEIASTAIDGASGDKKVLNRGEFTLVQNALANKDISAELNEGKYAGSDIDTVKVQNAISRFKHYADALSKSDMKLPSQYDGLSASELEARLKAESAAEKSARLEIVERENFEGSRALDKLGIKITGSKAKYFDISNVRSLVDANSKIIREMNRAIKKLHADPSERAMAQLIADNQMDAGSIPDSMDSDRILELADIYGLKRLAQRNVLAEQKHYIKKLNRELAEERFRGAEHKKSIGVQRMNYMTPRRIMIEMFGEQRGREIYNSYFAPVRANEAERTRWADKMMKDAGSITGADGKAGKLSKEERALVQMLIEGKAAAEAVKRMETEAGTRVIELAEKIVSGVTEKKAGSSSEFSAYGDIDRSMTDSEQARMQDRLDKIRQERRTAEELARRRIAEEAINDERYKGVIVDSAKIRNAMEYAEGVKNTRKIYAKLNERERELLTIMLNTEKSLEARNSLEVKEIKQVDRLIDDIINSGAEMRSNLENKGNDAKINRIALDLADRRIAGEAMQSGYYNGTQINAERIRTAIDNTKTHDISKTLKKSFEGYGERKSRLTPMERELALVMYETRESANVLESMSADDRTSMNAIVDDILENGEDAREERRTAEQYAVWLMADRAKAGGKWDGKKIDSVRIDNAVKHFTERYNDMYEAINDFLVAHGTEPIGFIKGYAPHTQPQEALAPLEQIFNWMAAPSDITELRAALAGKTHEFKPYKRWVPNFLSRSGDSVTNYDIYDGYESYIRYVSDVLYHMDDIMRLREASTYLREDYVTNHGKEVLSQIKDMRERGYFEKMKFLEANDRVRPGQTMTGYEIDDAMDRYTEDILKSEEKENAVSSSLVMWLDNYTNLLAGKQNAMDRGLEQRIGRKGIRAANRMVNHLIAVQVVGNMSSSLNQFAQMPLTMAELGPVNTALALKDIITGGGKIKQWALDNDFLATRRGVSVLNFTPTNRVSQILSTPLEYTDYFMSLITARAAYRQGLATGMSDSAAMKYSVQKSEDIMGSRAKGTKPVAFDTKNPIMRLVNAYQIEALNQWEHIGRDMPLHIKEIARTKGIKAAAGEAAKELVQYLIYAFLINRLCEATYGGTPAPLDLIGITGSFVAAGNGFTLNEGLIRWINGVFHSEVLKENHDFDAIREKNFADGFDWSAAWDDLKYSASTEIPLVSNMLAALGLTDDKTVFGSTVSDTKKYIKGMTDAIGEKNVGESLYNAMMGLSEWFYGGREVQKAAEGIRALRNNAGVTGSGKLSYPVEATAGTVANGVLFGKNALPGVQDYYAAGGSPMSDKNAELYRALVSAGEKPGDMYNIIHKLSGITGDKNEAGETIKGSAGLKKMQYIEELDISEEAKNILFANVITDAAAKDYEEYEIAKSGVKEEDWAMCYCYWTGLSGDDRKEQFRTYLKEEGYTNAQIHAIMKACKYMIPKQLEK